jgi:hypothetical protein
MSGGQQAFESRSGSSVEAKARRWSRRTGSVAEAVAGGTEACVPADDAAGDVAEAGSAAEVDAGGAEACAPAESAVGAEPAAEVATGGAGAGLAAVEAAGDTVEAGPTSGVVAGGVEGWLGPGMADGGDGERAGAPV